jgi:hypothetical protein
MYRTPTLLIAVLAIVIATTPILAQGAMGGGGKPRGAVMVGAIDTGKLFPLLRMGQVQRELKLTKPQLEKIDTLQKSLGKQVPAGAATADLSPEERKEQFIQMQKKRQEQIKAAEKELKTILNQRQAKRLDQIALQLRGVRALAEKKIAAALKMTEDQIAAINAAVEWSRSEQRKLVEAQRASSNPRDKEAWKKIREKMGKIRKEGDARILNVLTSSQKKQYTRMKGKPFKLAPMGRGGGGFAGAAKK